MNDAPTPAIAPDEPLLDTEGAARLLGVSPRTVQNWVLQRRIPAIKFGQGRRSLTRFRPGALREWIAAQEVPAQEVPAQEPAAQDAGRKEAA